MNTTRPSKNESLYQSETTEGNITSNYRGDKHNKGHTVPTRVENHRAVRNIQAARPRACTCIQHTALSLMLYLLLQSLSLL